MRIINVELEKKYHNAVEHWRRHWMSDYPLLLDNWDRYFPRDEPFCLCAKFELGTPATVSIGVHRGESKRLDPSQLSAEESQHLLTIIKAQASTEFGSIQQHAGTLARADNDEDRYWMLRVMAEELRHGYQMIYLLLSQDWNKAGTDLSSEQMVEEILSMTTGSHVLDAFNLDYDSFIDNVCFAALVDRVGKYQLTMQKVCAYKPFADSMPPMLREEAFHLAAGVVPLRRWAKRAAQGDPLVSMSAIQRSFNKWYPRALEMFGDERGGETNVTFGFKDMKNRQAQDLYIAEVERMVHDINIRFIRARCSHYLPDQADGALRSILIEHKPIDGMSSTDLLQVPDRRFFRRKGEHAWTMHGFSGEQFTMVDDYLHHLANHLPEVYLASRDMRLYADTLRKLQVGEITIKEANRKMPQLKRVGGVCPCSKSVRWIVEEPSS